MKCQNCGDEGAERRRQHTAYMEDETNFSILCPECQEEADRYWDDQWDDYYQSCM